jgi:outer membrane protein assembly factor BamD
LKPFSYAAFAASLIFILTLGAGCSVLNWAGIGSGDEPEPLPNAEGTFNEAEGLFAEGKYKKAREVYEQVKAHDPEKLYDPLVQIRLGDSYYEEGSYEEAEVEYQRFIDLRPRNKAAAYVKYQMGMCNFKRIGDPERDPAPAVNAARHFRELLDQYPGNPYEDEAKEKLRIARGNVAENEFSIGYYYYKTGEYRAAVGRFNVVRKDYPGSKVEPDALYYLTESYIELGLFESARETLAIMKQEHPTHELTIEAYEDFAPEIPE